jgi:hypothetical protein
VLATLVGQHSCFIPTEQGISSRVRCRKNGVIYDAFRSLQVVRYVDEIGSLHEQEIRQIASIDERVFESRRHHGGNFSRARFCIGDRLSADRRWYQGYKQKDKNFREVRHVAA